MNWMGEDMDIQLHTYEFNGAEVVEAVGEVDLHSADELRARLRPLCEAPRGRCVLDMRHVPFIDSTGVGVLVGALKRARENEGHFFIVAPQPRVLRVFEITGLLSAFSIYDSVEDAIGNRGSVEPHMESSRL